MQNVCVREDKELKKEKSKMPQTSESFSDAFDALSYNTVCHTAGLVLAVSSLALHKYIMRTVLVF